MVLWAAKCGSGKDERRTRTVYCCAAWCFEIERQRDQVVEMTKAMGLEEAQNGEPHARRSHKNSDRLSGF